MDKINIEGLSKRKILRALYKYAKPLGMGFTQFVPGVLPEEEVESIIEEECYLDYLKGRVMKVDIFKDELSTWLYDRDNGENAAYNALKAEGVLE